MLTPADARAAVQASFERLARGVVDNPSRVRAELPGGIFAVMPCVDHELGYAGLKTFAWLPGGTPFLVVLFSIERAELAAVVEADTLGQLRTAAASAVAAQLLARKGATRWACSAAGGRRRHMSLRCARCCLRSSASSSPVGTQTASRRSAPSTAASRRRSRTRPVRATSSSPQRPQHSPCCKESGSGPARSCSRSALTIPAHASSTTAVLDRAAFVCTDSREQALGEAGDLIGGRGRAARAAGRGHRRARRP